MAMRKGKSSFSFLVVPSSASGRFFTHLLFGSRLKTQGTPCAALPIANVTLLTKLLRGQCPVPDRHVVFSVLCPAPTLLWLYCVPGMWDLSSLTRNRTRILFLINELINLVASGLKSQCTGSSPHHLSLGHTATPAAVCGLSYPAACGILVTQPGIARWSLIRHWMTREVLLPLS